MKNLKISKKKGFSLVELLVVIAVIGVIAAIAIPAMSNIFGNSTAAKIKRNAQNIASAYSAARAAGASFSGAGGSAGSADNAATTLDGGINGRGVFSTSRFQVKLDPTERTAALTKLTYDTTNDILTYDGTGTTP